MVDLEKTLERAAEYQSFEKWGWLAASQLLVGGGLGLVVNNGRWWLGLVLIVLGLLSLLARELRKK